MIVYGGNSQHSAEQPLPPGARVADRRDMDYRERPSDGLPASAQALSDAEAARERARRNERARRERCLAEMLADPGDHRHGTSVGYQYGCRCERCKAAWRDYQRERYGKSRSRALAEMAADPADPRHGTRTGYDRGCRCGRCRAAKKESMMRYRSSRRAAGAGPREGGVIR